MRGVRRRACLERSGLLFGAVGRESGTVVPGGWRRGVAAAGSEGWREDVAQRVGLPGGVVSMRLWLVVEASAHAHDGDGGVGEAGEVSRQLASLPFRMRERSSSKEKSRTWWRRFSISQCPRLRARISEGPAHCGGSEVGPTRMAYQRVIPVVEVTAHLLGDALQHP